MISRRTVLAGVGTAAVVAVAGIGLGVREAASREAFMRSTLERYLGPLSIDDEQLEAFADGFARSEPHAGLGAKLALAAGAAASIGLSDGLRRVLPENDAGEVERFERALLASFHTTTTFPWVDAGERIDYVGDAGCSNPFAEFA